jgi:hypothetical protein
MVMGNTVLAQNAIFGLGPQTAKEVIATTYYRYKALAIGAGGVEDNRISPLEVGGTPYPTGAYKAGAFFAGDVTLQPRLEGDIGWVLYAATGSVSTVNDSPEAGLYTHYFAPLTTNTAYLPWLSAREHVPGATGTADDWGVVGQDIKIPRLRIVVPQNGTVTSIISLLGRVPTWSTAPDVWTWADVFEDFDSVPVSCCGHFEVPDGSEVAALGVSIDLVNQLTTPRQEMIVGAYYPDDIAVVSRTLTVSWVYKWADPDLVMALLTNAGSGASVAWSPVVYSTNLDLTVESPDNISGMANPFSLKVTAQSCNWQTPGPVELAGGDMIRQRYTGTVLEPAAGDYFQMALVNEQATYTWPS